MIGVVIVSVLAVAALAYVIAPLRRPDATELASGPTLEEEANERKGSALTAIVDLEEEARVGKLTDSELESLRGEYEREALLALEQLDQIGAQPHPEDPFESEIEAMKKRLACPSCGAVRTSGGACSRCSV